MTALVAACSKCGSDDILIRWHTGGRGRYGHGGCGYYANAVCATEHMHYTCRTCQHDWTGSPLDRSYAEFEREDAEVRALSEEDDHVVF